MIYQFLKYFVRIVFHFYFRKLYFSGEEKIPDDRGVLFAVNHPTAFLDPVFVASHIRANTHFLLRGDVFAGPFVIWFLRQIKTIPIFRFRDGYSNLKNNQDTFDRCYDLLGKGQNILVLAEGQTKHEKRLRPIQKGTARLLLGAYEKNPHAKYCILPIGVNYTAANKLRSEMMSGVGEPILLEDYLSDYQQNPRKAIKQITDEITRQLREKVVHIDRDEDVAFTNRLLTYKRNDRNTSLLPYFSRQLDPITEELKIAQYINEADEATRHQISAQVDQYEQLLKKYHLEDIALVRPGSFSTINTLLLIIGFPFFLIGYLFHYIPFLAGKNVADKKVKKPAFYGSVRFAIVLLCYLIPTIILLIVALILLSWKLFLGILLFYFLTYISVHYQDLYVYWNAARKWHHLDKTQQEALQKSRKQLVNLK